MRVDELKNKILQLAIQGKLVPQDENDIPASVLLEEIKKEKEQLIKEKKIKREKPLPEITEEEKLFELPKGWEWCRLGDISKIISKGTTPKGGKSAYIEEGINFLRVENITNDYNIDLSNIKLIYEKTHMQELKRSIAEENDLLISIAGTLGRVAVLRREHLPCNMNQAISFVRMFYSHINIEFFKYLVDSPIIKKSMIEKTKTTAQPNLTLEIISNLVIPLPSVAEQLRIVQKVDELFAIIDELSENKEAMLKNISDTRNKVLQLAIQGKLVEQNPEDTPVSVLLEEIRKEKEQLIKEKKIKKEKPLPEITEEEKPFKIPKGWEWVRLYEITEIIGDGLHGTPIYSDEGEYYFINGNNLVNGRVKVNDNVKKVSIDEYEKYKKDLNDKTVLYSINGTIGNIAFYNNEKIVLGKSSAYINVANLLDKKYLALLLKSPYSLKCFSEKLSGTTIKNLSLKSIRNLVVPLPSVEEQQRIVQKVDEIMAYLDELEKTILNDSII